MIDTQIREETNITITEFDTYRSDTYSVQWSPNARYIAFCGPDGTIMFWDRNTKAIDNMVTDEDQDNLTLAWSPAQPIIGVLMGNGLFHYISVNRNLFKPIYLQDAFSTRRTNHYSSSSISWSPFGDRIGVGVNPNRILIINHEGIEPYCKDIQNMRLQLEIKPMVWLPSNNIIASFDRELILYSNKGIRKNRIVNTEYPIEIVKFGHPNLIAITYDYQRGEIRNQRSVDIYTLSGQHVNSINLQFNQAYGLAFSPNKKYIAVAGESDCIYIHSVFDTSSEIFSIEIQGTVYSIDWSPDGKFLAVARIQAPPMIIEFLDSHRYQL